MILTVPATALEMTEGVSVGRGLKVDIYAPETVSKRRFGRKAPVVMYVHGGGWIKGSRKKVYSQHKWLTQKGYVFVAIDYRPVPKTTIDGQVQDVATSINWVRRNIRRYGGDGSRIVIMGHSAGAHLVAMIAAKNAAGPLRGVIPNDVQAYDMVAYGVVRGGIGHPYDKAFGSKIEDWVRWSPTTYARRNRNMPPHLIMHSGSQKARRKQLATGYANLLRSRGTQGSDLRRRRVLPRLDRAHAGGEQQRHARGRGVPRAGHAVGTRPEVAWSARTAIELYSCRPGTVGPTREP